MQIPSEIDTNSFEGLTRLLRFTIGMRDNDEDKAALKHLEKRFGLTAYEPQLRGALEDFAEHLNRLESKQRFEAVCSLISGAIDPNDILDQELAQAILDFSRHKRIVRFSFTPSLLLCLKHAQIVKPKHFLYELRYSGVGLDKELAAFASLFLNLAIYVESNPPWVPDMVFDDSEPNTELPDLEISFPPANFKLNDAPHLEESVRASKLPRAVDRGKYDLESVMLDYLCFTERSVLVFTSESFLHSTKQSRLLVRQRLLDFQRIDSVTELTMTSPHLFLIELAPELAQVISIRMAVSSDASQIGLSAIKPNEDSRKVAYVPVSDIRSAGDTLKPARYLVTGPAGGRNLAEHFRNAFYPGKYKLADLFEITRPKTTRHDPVGTFEIQEVRAGNISANGEITGQLRRISIRSTLAIGLEEQLIKPGDILFAHRGPIGHATYVTDATTQKSPMWAGQTLLIFRPRKRSSGNQNAIYCDPRVLFMYLLTPAVQKDWSRSVSDERSPAIPIGRIESLNLPENLILPRKPKKGDPTASQYSSHIHKEQILTEYQKRQKQLMNLRELQDSMNEGLVRVWDSAWEKQVDGKN
ncbi:MULTISPECIES: hypothetical protein [Pacificibacter]|uniref:hypothetical protein n=1 Tax=Pacificibacter TaxID=1042323 RepID=UPI001C09C7AE|nr:MULTISPECIES: hypothetical protein [Pacificibacter]MBU2936464.1 hypothetical protein [Pacificibacter marinus]MDO6614734.1 hypothetical protein [Pacificibacter sp. 1_MG-2023]